MDDGIIRESSFNIENGVDIRMMLSEKQVWCAVMIYRSTSYIKSLKRRVPLPFYG